MAYLNPNFSNSCPCCALRCHKPIRKSMCLLILILLIIFGIPPTISSDDVARKQKQASNVSTFSNLYSRSIKENCCHLSLYMHVLLSVILM